jgi:hypothetical protein
MKFKIKVNINDIKAGVRTAGALMLGNSLVAPVITNGATSYWWVLLFSGIMCIVLTSLQGE